MERKRPSGRTMHAVSQVTSPSFLKSYAAQLDQIEQELGRIIDAMLPSGISTVDFEASLAYSTLSSGKRLRPLLALVCGEIYDLKIDTFLTAACSVELIHTGSLMLDDLPCMDNAQLRRGKATSHVKYGESTTILSSAALWVEAFRILSTVDSQYAAELVRMAAEAVGGKGLIQGQLLDLAAFNATQNEAELAECYRLKTGTLFELAVTIGPLLAGVDKSDITALRRFAVQFGIAFQIRDDVLGAILTEKESGKDSRADAKNHKPTYVSLLGIDGAQAALLSHVAQAKKELECVRADTAALVNIVESALNLEHV